MHSLTPLFVLALAPLALTNPLPLPTGIPTASAAKTELASITVSAGGDGSGYERSLFPTWNTINGTCDTRETVLKRDGTDVVVDSACASTSGNWLSVYDGAKWTDESDLDIDHLVPLSNAWKVSGLKRG